MSFVRSTVVVAVVGALLAAAGCSSKTTTDPGGGPGAPGGTGSTGPTGATGGTGATGATGVTFTRIDTYTESLAVDTIQGGGGEATVAALQTALSQAGFSQPAQASGLEIYPPESPTQGIAFEQFDVAYVAQQMGAGVRVPLRDFVGGLVGLTKGQRTAEVMRGAFLGDLRAAAASSVPTTRFWAQYVVALGQQREEAPYDLLDPTVGDDVLLDPVQLALVHYRLAGDLWAEAQRSRPVGIGRMSSALVAGERPCTTTDTEGTIMDGAATAAGIGFGAVIDAVKDTIPAAEKVGAFTGAANAVLTAVKFFWTYAAFEGRVETDGPELVRNKTRAAGEQRALTATFRLNFGNFQAVNCLRPMLNGVGLDFSLWNDGPLAGARVDWEAFRTAGKPGELPIVRFAPSPTGDGTVTSSPIDRITDANGVDRVVLEGSPRSRDLLPTVEPVYRLVPVLAKVQLKGTKMEQDIIDAIGTWSSGPYGAVTFLTEMLFRMNTPVFAGRYTLAVVDWEELAKPMVHVVAHGTGSGAVLSDGRGAERVELKVDLRWALEDAARPLQISIVNGVPFSAATTVLESGYRSIVYGGTLAYTEPCLCEAGTLTYDAALGYALATVATADERALSLVIEPDGKYTLRFPLGTVWGTGDRHVKSSGCGPDEENTVDRPKLLAGLQTDAAVQGTLDLAAGSGVIEGLYEGTMPIPLPAALGGFHGADGARGTPEATLLVEYQIPWVANRIALPGGAAAPAPVAVRPKPAAAVTGVIASKALPDPALRQRARCKIAE